MRRRYATLGLLAFVAGCSAPMWPAKLHPYELGQVLILRYRTEMHMLTPGDNMLRLPPLMDVRTGKLTPDRRGLSWDSESAWVEWGEGELRFRAHPGHAPNQVRLAGNLLRLRTGNSYRGVGEDTKHEVWDSALPEEPNTRDQSREELRALMRPATISVLVRNDGVVLHWDANGGHYDELKEQMRNAPKRVTAQNRELAIAVRSIGAVPAMLDAVAYLPPPNVALGQSWPVRREDVFPYHGYGFYMLTNGCYWSSEQSTCTARYVERTRSGRVLTVAIAGKRFPKLGLEPGQSERVDYLELDGALRLNLDTGAIEELRLESRAHFLSAKDRDMFRPLFVETIGLQPGEPKRQGRGEALSGARGSPSP